ncbi:YaaR family protein [Spirochaeta dissipatitropha]
MERIDIQPGAYFPLVKPDLKKKTDEKKQSQKKSGIFQKLFEAEENKTTAATVENSPIHIDDAEELFQQIQSAGEKLKRFPGAENVNDYKRLVRSLVERVVREGIIVEEHSSGTHILKRKSFSLLTVIDSKLAQLAEGMLATQRDQMELLAKVDEIQGLIVDLLH